MKPEHAMQHPFRKIEVVQGLSIFLAVLVTAWWQRELPDRTEFGWRVASLEFKQVKLDPSGFGDWRLTGAWRLRSNDPRFGGFSALALIDGRFVALTDGGVVAQFGKPSSGHQRARIGELPAGPGRSGFKANRDSESIAWDPASGRWWVGFENSNEIWAYDKAFRHGVATASFGAERWPRNRGIEGMVSDRAGMLLFSEEGDRVVQMRGNAARELVIENPAGRVSDVVRLPSGELVVINRHVTILGIANSIASLEQTPRGYRYGQRTHLGLGALDNVEAASAEKLHDGTTRLWLMTDDANQRPFRTLLIALDLPPKRRAPQPPS
jgi:hypothetical protein